MRKFLLISLLIASYLLLANVSYAQTDPRSAIGSGLATPNGYAMASEASEERIAQLRQQIEQLEKEAEQYRGNVASEQAKAKSLKSDIAIFENQIKKLQAQIKITSKNIDKTSIEIEGLENNIFDTQQKIQARKNAIGQLILFLDRQDKENLLTILLKNQNLSDFIRHTQYSANVSTSLLVLINSLEEVKYVLEEQKRDADKKKEELELLNQRQMHQRVSISEMKLGKNNLLTKTKGQEAQYKKFLKEVDKKKAEFFKELRELELKVISGGLYIVHITADNLPPKGTKLFQWPEDDYYITQDYGMTNYARRGAYGGAPHNGIDITGGLGGSVKAIGDGQIVANGFNNGWGNWVAIKHPNNLVSVYGHMSILSFLKVGTHVKTGDIIGYEGSTGQSTGSHLHLSLYKEFFTYINSTNGQLYFNFFQGSINPLDYM